MKAKICIDTMTDVQNFVKITSDIPSKVTITDNSGLSVNAKSVLGVLYTMEFDELWCESEEDIWSKISDFVI